MIKAKKWIAFLLLSQLATSLLLIAVCSYYRVPQKVYRRIFVESRVPFICKDFESNRLYTESRHLFDVYDSAKDGVLRIRMLVVGDSQVSMVNWNELLPGFDATGRGIPGDTVDGLAYRINDYHVLSPDTCVVLVGTNDVLADQTPIETEESYRGLIGRALQIWPQTKIVMVSLPPFSTWVTQAEAKNARVQQINARISELSNELPRTRYLNLHDLVADQGGYLADTMTMDGVHLNASAYAVLRDELIAICAN